MKSKRELLDCVNYLTKGHGALEEPNNIDPSKVFQLDEEGRTRLTESDLQGLIDEQSGWPYFGKIFMISALNGDGVGDIQVSAVTLPPHSLFSCCLVNCSLSL